VRFVVSQMKQIVLVDGKNQLYRMHYQPSMMGLSREDGFPTGAIYGCVNYSLLAVAERLPDASFVWCWDGLGETWRHKLLASTEHFEPSPVNDDDEEDTHDAQADVITNTLSYFGIKKQAKKSKPKVRGYKANRVWSPTKSKSKYPTDERQRALIQVPVLKLILEGIGITQFEIQNLECDDLIGILTHKIMEMDEDCEIIIFSADRDFYQLLQYEQVKIVKNVKDGKLQYVDGDQVEYEFNVSLKDWTKYRAWTGDEADNIPHIAKIGPKTALKLLEAGYDPSEEEVPCSDAEEYFAKYFAPHGIEKMWASVHTNYKLCELVTDPKDKILSEEVRQRLHKDMKYVKRVSDLQRDKKANTPESYRKVTMLLSAYELASLLAKRDELFQIP
jgi:5'-3' exonuclease